MSDIIKEQLPNLKTLYILEGYSEFLRDTIACLAISFLIAVIQEDEEFTKVFP